MYGGIEDGIPGLETSHVPLRHGIIRQTAHSSDILYYLQIRHLKLQLDKHRQNVRMRANSLSRIADQTRLIPKADRKKIHEYLFRGMHTLRQK